MEKKEAVWILENGAWWDSLPDDMSDADKNPLLAAIDVALDALKMPEKREPMTIEQLRKMDGQPVWIVEWPEWGHWELSEDAEDYIIDRRKEFYGLKQNATEGKYGLHKRGWLAYAYPPAHIDREAWKPCELCISCENCKNSNVGEFCNPCFRCLQSDKKDGFSPVGFCRECGQPLTEEAWAELEKRLRGCGE